MSTPELVICDVNETLIDFSGLGPSFELAGLSPSAVPWWFATLLRDGFAVNLTGGSVGFVDLGRRALREIAHLSRVEISDAVIQSVLDSIAHLGVHPDVVPALRTLLGAGIPVVALTNGSAELARSILARAGVPVEEMDVVGALDVGGWKPLLEPYRSVVHEAGVNPRRTVMVAAHPWDLHGAEQAGLLGAYVDRAGAGYPSFMEPPTATARDLVELVDIIVEL
ncbi:MAG: HAD family hydrolase [Acidimicrobiaceae bacterium]|nr:HAD family hydrolase [Acidimicrobiaceae bacterium]